jgi:hypothetical protein
LGQRCISLVDWVHLASEKRGKSEKRNHFVGLDDWVEIYHSIVFLRPSSKGTLALTLSARLTSSLRLGCPFGFVGFGVTSSDVIILIDLVPVK